MIDAAEKIYVCIKLNVITTSRTEKAANVLYGMFKRTRRRMEIKVPMFQVWDQWYKGQCTERKVDVKLALKDYKKRDNEESISR
jgi:hypothetical protein